jgi:hypothetical protein
MASPDVEFAEQPVSPDDEEFDDADQDDTALDMAEVKSEPENAESNASSTEQPSKPANSTNGSGKPNAKDPLRPRRKKARRACLACQRAHLTCSEYIFILISYSSRREWIHIIDANLELKLDPVLLYPIGFP